MIARIRKDLDNKEKGFTLIELLVVIIIIGILAAIAIPLFLNQRKQAVDSAARADVSTLGKELATYYVDNNDAPTLGYTEPAGDDSGYFTINTEKVSNASDHVSLGNYNLDPVSWCVQVKIAEGKGTLETVTYGAETSMTDDGTCAGPAGDPDDGGGNN